MKLGQIFQADCEIINDFFEQSKSSRGINGIRRNESRSPPQPSRVRSPTETENVAPSSLSFRSSRNAHNEKEADGP